MKSYAEVIGINPVNWRWNLLCQNDHHSQWNLLQKLCVDWQTSPIGQLSASIPRNNNTADPLIKGCPLDSTLRTLDLKFQHAIWRKDATAALNLLSLIEEQAEQILEQERLKANNLVGLCRRLIKYFKSFFA